MASLLEATNALLDLDGVWPLYFPLSPTAFPAPPLVLSSMPSSSISSNSSEAPLAGASYWSDDDDSAIMTSVTVNTSSVFHHQELLSPQPSSTESCTDLLSTIDVSVLSSSSSDSAFGEGDSQMNTTEDSSSSSASATEMGASAPQKFGENSHGENPSFKKRRAAVSGKTRRPTSVNNTLPPCRICGDAASGFHYGVNTCEACKRFFRRALKRKRLFKCKGNKTCSLLGKMNKKHLCGHCRLSRCLAVGMSRTKIKTGRYTHEKRARDSQEVQQLTQTTSTSSPSSSPSSSSSPVSAVSMSEEEVTETLHKLLTAHAEVLTNAGVPREAMLRRAAETAEEFRLKMDVFQIQESLTPEQYDEIFRETGLDVDERQKHMKYVAKSLDIFVRGYVHFGKGVPGFGDLPLTDQTNLLKLARTEVWFLGAYKGFLKEYDVFYAPSNDVRHRLEMEQLLGKEYMDFACRLASCLQAMDLHYDEVVVLKAVCLTFTDRCQIQDAKKVEEIQWKMLRVFFHLLSTNHHKDPARFFYKVIDILVALRTLTELSQKALAVTYFSDAIRNNSTLFDLILV